MAEKKWKMNLFTICDYEEEEQYLTKMHRSGWKLHRSSLFFAVFERCESENVVYRIDFVADDKDKDSYFQMFRDYGWEYVDSCNDFVYFRKATNGLTEEETEIFSDDQSRLEMISHIIRWKLIPALLLFFFCALPNILRFFTFTTVYTIDVSMVILYSVLLVVLIFLFLHLFKGFYRLKKKYSKK